MECGVESQVNWETCAMGEDWTPEGDGGSTAIEVLLRQRVPEHLMSANGTDDQENDTGFSTEQLNLQIILLQSLWRTESHAPEILPYQEELIEEIKTMLIDQENTISEKMAQGRESEYFTITLYQMEMERIRFVLSSYLRCRLRKIEAQAEFLVKNEDLLDSLSEAERVFVSRLNNLNNTHFVETVHTRLKPESAEFFNRSKDRVNHAEPNLEAFVFCQALEPLYDLAVSDEMTQSYQPGDVVVLRYAVIREHVISGRMQLL